MPFKDKLHSCSSRFCRVRKYRRRGKGLVVGFAQWREGWFLPRTSPPAAAPAPASFAPQIQAAAQTMQQRMKQATFTSFVENPRKPVQSKIEVSAMCFGCRDSGTMSTLKTNSNSTRMSRRKPPDTARFFASAACTCSPRSQPT